MKYEEFRDRLLDALQHAGLIHAHLTQQKETLDLSSTAKRWKVYFGKMVDQPAKPFHVSGRITFEWSPFEAARSYTCEEDLLTELYDRDQYSKETSPRSIRVDISLYAKLPYGSTTPMPKPEVWKSWSESVEERLEGPLPKGDYKTERRLLPEVEGYRSDLLVETHCSEDGQLTLQGVSVSAFRFVTITRVWDDPEKREKEEGTGQAEIDELTQRFKEAMDEWEAAAVEFGRWIQYGDVRAGLEGVEDPFADVDDDEEPETEH